MATTPTIDTILAHRSIRQFEDKPISDELLHQLIQCGQMASTSSFIQACSVIHVTDTHDREKISMAAGGQPYVKTAAVFLVFCADLLRINHVCIAEGLGELEGHTEHFLAASVDAALMAQNVMLAAESQGLGGVYIGGIRNDPQTVSDVLELPEHVYPVFGMCLGWPAQDPDSKPRLPVDVVLHTGKYQQDSIVDDIDTYDQAMQAYYQARSANNKTTTWSEQTAAAVQKKKREHLLAFLQNKSFLKL